MKQSSKVRQCLFNSPQFYWYKTEKVGQYPKINNVVTISNTRTEHTQPLSVPTEIYLVMDQQHIKEIYGFRLENNLFIAETDKGDLKLWVYNKQPTWSN